MLANGGIGGIVGKGKVVLFPFPAEQAQESGAGGGGWRVSGLSSKYLRIDEFISLFSTFNKF